MISQAPTGLARPLPVAPPGVDSKKACGQVGAAGGSGLREVCAAQGWCALLVE